MGLSDRQSFALTTDLVVFAFNGNALRLLLIRRANDPFAGSWALPGGFLEHGETLDQCARRELAEETGLELRQLDQLAAFSGLGRDPRGNVVSVAYLAIVRAQGHDLRAGSDASEAAWHDLNALPPLAFDHADIVAAARLRLADVLYTTTAAFELLPQCFTLADAQCAFESIVGEPIDKRNFRAWAHKSAPLRETGATRRGPHRPAKLYELAKDREDHD